MDWPKLDWPKLVKSGWPKRDWPKSVSSSDAREHRYQLEGTKRGIRLGESKCRVTRTDDDKVQSFIVVPCNRDSIQNLITGALQADTVQVMVPADSNSITVIAIDNHKSGKIQGQRLDSILRLFNQMSKADSSDGPEH